MRASILGEGSDRLQLIKFWPSCAPGKGAAGGIFAYALLATADSLRLRGSAAGRSLITANAQCLRLSERFFISDWIAEKL